jgi:hypothetical protein
MTGATEAQGFIFPPSYTTSPSSTKYPLLSQLLLVLLFLLSFQVLCAIELPIVFKWDSLNSGYYTKAQTNKDISWDEFYRISIIVDSLSYKHAQLKLQLQNQADFLKNYLEIKEIQLAYGAKSWSVFAASKPIGYGMRNKLNPYYIVSPAQDDFLYQESRFNGAGVGYDDNNAHLTLAMGGNVQNQSMAYLSAAWGKEDKSFLIALAQEARAMDSHWRTPVSITALKLISDTPLLKLSTETAISYYPARDLTKEHFSSFNQIELGICPAPQTYIYVAAETNSIEPSGKALKQFHTALSKELGAFAFTPGFTLDLFDGISSRSYHFLSEWRVAKHQRLGVVYKYEENENITGRHFVGVQAELLYGI